MPFAVATPGSSEYTRSLVWKVADADPEGGPPLPTRWLIIIPRFAGFDLLEINPCVDFVYEPSTSFEALEKKPGRFSPLPPSSLSSSRKPLLAESFECLPRLHRPRIFPRQIVYFIHPGIERRGTRDGGFAAAGALISRVPPLRDSWRNTKKRAKRERAVPRHDFAFLDTLGGASAPRRINKVIREDTTEVRNGSESFVICDIVETPRVERRDVDEAVYDSKVTTPPGIMGRRNVFQSSSVGNAARIFSFPPPNYRERFLGSTEPEIKYRDRTEPLFPPVMNTLAKSFAKVMAAASEKKASDNGV
ncbi:hypothetical protein KM043_006002 [Ampulex compressa]|nr:hypothetical protein KM043_006002 [Ampulex compressa]